MSGKFWLHYIPISGGSTSYVRKENYADPNEMFLYHFKNIQNKVIVFEKILQKYNTYDILYNLQSKLINYIMSFSLACKVWGIFDKYIQFICRLHIVCLVCYADALIKAPKSLISLIFANFRWMNFEINIKGARTSSGFSVTNNCMVFNGPARTCSAR